MFGIEVGAPPLPDPENRLAFIRRYADDSGQRLARLTEKDEAWWEQEVAFFDTTHIRAWIWEGHWFIDWWQGGSFK
jgi:hypothetical protein